jgi:hypothetical protein
VTEGEVSEQRVAGGDGKKLYKMGKRKESDGDSHAKREDEKLAENQQLKGS